MGRLREAFSIINAKVLPPPIEFATIYTYITREEAKELRKMVKKLRIEDEVV